MDQTSLIVGVITSAIGMGYFVYGKKQGKLIPMLAGGGLCVIPYMMENGVLLALVCAALCALPFVIKAD